MTTTLEVADVVLLKVCDIEISSLKNLIQIYKFMPSGTPMKWGYTYIPNIHTYAIIKNIPDKIYVVYTPRIGYIKKKCSILADMNTQISSYETRFTNQKYDVMWEEREERNKEKGLGRHNSLESFYGENLVKMKDIERFLSEKEFPEYCSNFLENIQNVAFKTNK